MTARDQIAEINAQYAERVKLLERERDAKVAIVRGKCGHEEDDEPSGAFQINGAAIYEKTGTCKHCGAPMP